VSRKRRTNGEGTKGKQRRMIIDGDTAGGLMPGILPGLYTGAMRDGQTIWRALLIVSARHASPQATWELTAQSFFSSLFPVSGTRAPSPVSFLPASSCGRPSGQVQRAPRGTSPRRN